MYVRLCAALAGCLVSCAAIAYDYFEHRYLGNRAYDDARGHLERKVKSKEATKEEATLHRTLTSVEARLQFSRQMSAAEVAEEMNKGKELSFARRMLIGLPFRYGDLAALAGDFVEDPVAPTPEGGEKWDPERAPEELQIVIKGVEEIEAGQPYPYYLDVPREAFGYRFAKAKALVVDSRRQWLSACRWFYRTRVGSPEHRLVTSPPDPNAPLNDCFDSADSSLKKPPSPRHAFGSAGYHVSREEKAEHERIPDYVSLAAVNRKHFPRYSWKAYSDHHERALRLAREYSLGQNEDLLVDALLHEAFAQHYLHDSFASGHIGSQFSVCEAFFCQPTKARLLQTHDALNELGLHVRLIETPTILGKFRPDVDLVKDGWTSFGDAHLFIAEADFHRALLVKVATESLKEVFAQAATRSDPAGKPPACPMCTTGIFPIPKEQRFLSAESREGATRPLPINESYVPNHLVEFDREPLLLGDKRSRDERVTGLPHEGWKIGVGFARQWYNLSEAGDQHPRLADNGVLLRFDYVRSYGRWIPNSVGFEYNHVPDRGSTYLGTVAWVFPVEVSARQLGLKAKAGWRTEENFTTINPGQQRGGGFQLSFPVIEGTWSLFQPLAIFFQWNLYTYVIREPFFKGGHNYTENVSSKEHSFTFGLRFDLAGI